MGRFDWPAGVFPDSAVAYHLTEDVEIGNEATAIAADVAQFAGVVFDGELKAKIKDSSGSEDLDRVASRGTKAGAISLVVADEVKKVIGRYMKIKNNVDAQDSWDPTTTYGQVWRAVVDDEARAGGGITPSTLPEVTGLPDVVSLTKANQDVKC